MERHRLEVIPPDSREQRSVFYYRARNPSDMGSASRLAFCRFIAILPGLQFLIPEIMVLLCPVGIDMAIHH